MRIIFTICFLLSFLRVIGQDSLSVPSLTMQQDSNRFIRQNMFINDYSDDKFSNYYNSSPLYAPVDNVYSSAKNKVTNTVSDVGKTFKQKPTLHGTTAFQTQYINNGYAPASTNGFYTTARIATKVTIFKIPLNTGIALQMHDKQFRMDYTSVNLNFDVNSFKDNIKNGYQNYIGDIKNYFGDGLGQLMEQYQDSVKKLESSKTTLSDSKYYDKVNQYSAEVKQLGDSIKIDSCNTALIDEYERKKDSVKILNDVRTSYRNTTAYVNKYKEYGKLYEEYKDYVDRVKSMDADQILEQPGVQNALKKTGVSMPKLDFVSGIQKMNIGRVAPEASRYTFRQQTLYGLQLDYLTKNRIYIGGAFGWASQFNMQLSPSFFFNQQYRSFNPSRLAGYLRGGYGGLNDNHVHVIWTGFGDKFNTSTISAEQNSAQANAVLSVEFLQKLGKAITIKGEAATSHSSDSNRLASIVPVASKPPVNYAAYSEISGNIQATQTTISVKGEVVSDKFLSMTAPFLRRAIAGYAVGLEQSLFKSKVTYSGVFQHSFQNYTNKRLLNAFISSSNTFMIQASEKAIFQLYYGWFGNVPGKESIVMNVNQTHTATLSQQYGYNLKKVRIVTVLITSYSYSRTEVPEVHTPAMHNLQQGLQQQFVFPKQISWNIGGGGLYRTQPVTATDNSGWGWWVETGNTFSIKKIVNMQYQLKYLYDPMLSHQMNISPAIDINIYKGLRLNINGICYISLTQQYVTSNRISTTAGIAYSW